jgi:hypothetical protein
MRTDILIVGVVLAVFAAGCGSGQQAGLETTPAGTNSPPREAPLPAQFAFIQTNLDVITLEEITNRIGQYSRVGHLSPDSPELTYEFDLPDHSALLVTLERPFQARNRVHRVQYFLNTNDFHLYP